MEESLVPIAKNLFTLPTRKNVHIYHAKYIWLIFSVSRILFLASLKGQMVKIVPDPVPPPSKKYPLPVKFSAPPPPKTHTHTCRKGFAAIATS